MARQRKLLLTIQDVAELLSVSERTVRNLVAKGELTRPHKVNGRLARWEIRAVRDYLAWLRAQK